MARQLRRLANRLAPPAGDSGLLPIEFIPSVELAAELRQRSDICVIFYGRVSRTFGVPTLTCSCQWRMSEQWWPESEFFSREAVANHLRSDS